MTAFDLPPSEPNAKELQLLAVLNDYRTISMQAGERHSAALAALANARARVEEIAQTGRVAGLNDATDAAWEAECAVDDAQLELMKARDSELVNRWPYEQALAQRLRQHAGTLRTLATRAAKAAEVAELAQTQAEMGVDKSQEGARAAWSEWLRFEKEIAAKRTARVRAISHQSTGGN